MFISTRIVNNRVLYISSSQFQCYFLQLRCLLSKITLSIKEVFMRTILPLFFLLGLNLFASPYYLSLGVGNIGPTSDFKKFNAPSIGYTFQIQNRGYCNLWYGLRIDYSPLDSSKDATIGSNVFDKYLSFSPELRYVYLLSSKHSLNDVFYLFGQGLINFSSITRRQPSDDGNFGLGGYLGAGVGYCFILFKTCCTLEFNGMYGSPNFIIKPENRPTLTNYNFGLTLGVRL